MLKSLLCISMCLILSSSMAQNPQGPKITVHKTFSPIEIERPEVDATETNCLKWNFGMIGHGALELSFEKAFTKPFSLEAGAGLTYRDFVYEYLHEMSLDNDNQDDPLAIRPGFVIHFSARYYVSDGNLEGIYFSPVFRYRNYNISTEPSVYSTNKSIDLGYSMTEFGFVFGKQEYLLDWDIVGEAFLGIGLANTMYHHYEEINMNGDDGWVKKTKIEPVIFLGYTIGLPF